MKNIIKFLSVALVSFLLISFAALTVEAKKKGRTGPLALAAAKDTPKITTEQDLVSHLEGLVVCQKVGGDERSFYCNLKFRGLDVDFAGVNAPLSRTKAPVGGVIYVTALGANQILYPLGNRCLVARFADKDLLVDGHGDHTEVVLRNDGNISYLFNNNKAKNACYDSRY